MVCCLFQNVSPICWRLGEKVITNCAAKLRPYLMEVAKRFSEDAVCPGEVGAFGDESLKSTICNDASETKDDTLTAGNPLNRLDQHSTKKLLVETTDKPVKIPQKRSWKPYFLVNPEEGYDYCWIGRRKRGNPRKIITEASSIQTNP
ncbi:hypothetical protein PVL29_011866 [Vitis rotundifolia]|uniref:Uncharacterized protein n=1 Tax=Vitis rotundifolia TaxID=103349 RepID=A0AA38ZQ60_VITRO|nr:hypothetical protein PVL29_011866 [Vitis rotundifolia]